MRLNEAFDCLSRGIILTSYKFWIRGLLCEDIKRGGHR